MWTKFLDTDVNRNGNFPSALPDTGWGKLQRQDACLELVPHLCEDSRSTALLVSSPRKPSLITRESLVMQSPSKSLCILIV